MSQNISHAVMAQRAEPNDSLDDFPTPPWGTRALFHMFDRFGLKNTGRSCWEPAANRGFMVRPLRERFADVHASDVHDYGCGFTQQDFLWPLAAPAGLAPSTTPAARSPFPVNGEGNVDWIVTNPPFRLAQEFALTAMRRARVGTALLVRTAFLESVARYGGLFAPHRPHFVFQFVERLPMVRGRCDGEVSTATSYAWIVWLSGGAPSCTMLEWIPPCRAKLERDGDYQCDSTAASIALKSPPAISDRATEPGGAQP